MHALGMLLIYKHLDLVLINQHSLCLCYNYYQSLLMYTHTHTHTHSYSVFEFPDFPDTECGSCAPVPLLWSRTDEEGRLTCDLTTIMTARLGIIVITQSVRYTTMYYDVILMPMCVLTR